MEATNDAVDSQGTSADEARQILNKFGDNGFSSDTEKIAIVLGRSADEISAFLSGEKDIDDDLLMKIRGIAKERNIEIE